MASVASHKTKYRSLGTFHDESKAEDYMEKLHKNNRSLKMFVRRRSSWKDKRRYSVLTIVRSGSKRR